MSLDSVWLLPKIGILFVALFVAGILFGCESEEAPSEYAARVGDHYLTQSELDRRLKGMGPTPDSAEARQQIIEQWIDRTLLLREAERLNLEQDEAVQQRLEKQRRNALVSAMQDRIYEDTDQEPSDEEIRTYFERHRNELTLREPYVRVRHLTTSSEDSARAVRRELRSVSQEEADSIWTQLTDTYATNPERARALGDRFIPESRLFAQLPYVRDELSRLQDGSVAPVIEGNDQFHVLQLVRRIPEGSEPELHWLEAEIRRRLKIRSRKQMYAREVERLRNRAKADDLVETP